MTNVLLIADPGGVVAARHIGAGLADYTSYLFDAALGDAAADAGLRNVKLFSRLGGEPYHAMHRDAHAAARALETTLDAAQQRAGSNLSIAGWQHANLYYLFMTLNWYSGLWARMSSQIPAGNLFLFVHDRPADYYLPSFIPSMLLTSQLNKDGRSFTSYDLKDQDPIAYPIPDLQGSPPERGSGYLLTHLPTCFYDIDYFAAEIKATGRVCVNIEAKRWGVKFEAGQPVGLIDMHQVLPRLAPAALEQLTAFTHAIEGELDRCLQAHIEPPVYRARQVRHLVELYRSQWVTHAELQRCFADSVPDRLLLSDHDAGFHGPLIAFAEQRSLPVTLVPHSKTSVDHAFGYAGITSLTHPLQGKPIHDATGRLVPGGLLNYPETFASADVPSAGLRRISLLLTALSLSGIPFAPFDTYLEGIKIIHDWCRIHGVDLKIRCKPGFSIHGLLSVYLNLDVNQLADNTRVSMTEHLQGCDLCLMYDVPTTGALYLLRNAVPILNPLISRQSASCDGLLHTGVIAPQSLPETLGRLDVFHADAHALEAFRQQQFRAYVARFAAARPLRSYL